MRLLVLVMACILQVGACAAKDPYAGKKLIEYGWDCPDTAFVRKNFAEMEQKVPFDGIVIKLISEKRTDNITREVGWRVFSKTRFTPRDYDFGIKDLKDVKFKQFTDNFIQVIAYPGDVDFLDPEWSAVAFNAACLAKVAKQTGCKGIMFDPEHYSDHHIWDYQSVPADVRAAHPYKEYAAKVKERGKEFMQAINKEYPDITILALFGPCLSYLWTNDHPDLEKIQYGLLISFYDGMCEAATRGTTIVDGFEPSYGYTSRYPFEDGRDIVLNRTKTVSTNQKEFTDHIRCGFGIWADYDSLKRGWHPEDFSKNYYSPEQLKTSLGLALQVSDKYVWVYSERLRWWDFSVPAPYVDALKLAKTVK